VKFCFFLLGKQPTILLISRTPNFTKFEHTTSIGVVMNSFQTEFWKFFHKGPFFQEWQKLEFFFQRFATLGKFRLP